MLIIHLNRFRRRLNIQLHIRRSDPPRPLLDHAFRDEQEHGDTKKTRYNILALTAPLSNKNFF